MGGGERAGEGGSHGGAPARPDSGVHVQVTRAFRCEASSGRWRLNWIYNIYIYTLLHTCVYICHISHIYVLQLHLLNFILLFTYRQYYIYVYIDCIHIHNIVYVSIYLYICVCMYMYVLIYTSIECIFSPSFPFGSTAQ